MAHILPPYIDKNCKSTGERLLFDMLKNSTFTKDWIVLHSLNLSQHTKRLYGEIDFLLLIPRGGIYIMEVKSGGVKYIDGVWYFTDKYNNQYTSNIGPFNQARDAMFSLRSAIEREFSGGHRFSKIIYGFLCAFPHISFDRNSVEYESWQILDKHSIQSGIQKYFQNLIQSYIKKFRTQKWFSEKDSLPDVEVLHQLCDYLRGDFERVRTVKARLEEYEKQVKSYTSEQYSVLDHINLNDRCIIEGSAGTGKTMIAIESAVRSAQQGKKVFLTCFNRLVGEWMRKQIDEYKEDITVASLHYFLFEQSKGFHYDKSQINKKDFYSKYLPSLIRDIYLKGISNRFDKLIIDEGQDLLKKDYLNLFDSMLTGGLEKGQWEIYGDFERQAIYAQLSKEEMYSLIQNYAHPSRFLLRINCRNTKQIGEETSIISGFVKPPFLLEYLEGIPVEYLFYNNPIHQAEILELQLNNLVRNMVPYSALRILSPKKFENSCASLISGFTIKEMKNTVENTTSQDYFSFSTVQAFKGMESNYIILSDIEDLTSEMAKSILYVGMSRAKYALIMLISEKMRNQYRDILKIKIN